MHKQRSSSLVLFLSFVPSLFSTLVLSCNLSEREALLDLKHHLSDHRRRLSSWSSDSFSCCDWAAVGCDPISGDILRLDLGNPNASDPYSSLSGNLPPTFSRLRRLRYLNLSGNDFRSFPIPTFLASFHDLEYLDLSLSYFAGPIPPEFGNLAALRSLDFAGLYAGFSDATEPFSMLASLPSLQRLQLSGCRIGAIPHSLPNASSFPRLLFLDLSMNDFNSSIPPWLFGITTLEYLSLEINDFKGPIPASVGNLASLQSLSLSVNADILTFGLPREFSHLCSLRTLEFGFINASGFELNDFREAFDGCVTESLELLDFSYASLSGHLPDWFGAFKRLKTLDLSVNSLNGAIPYSIGGIASLQELKLRANLLNGSIPESLGQLSNLTCLSLISNSFTGVLSEAHFEKLSSLKNLEISSNTLIIDLGKHWVAPFQLEYISLRDCKLGPQFPQWLQTQKYYYYLDLANTGISDSLPNWFWSISSNFTYLDLSNNEISGTVPSSVSMAPADYIDLSSNYFEGPLPVFPSTIKKLLLSNNLFSGIIPSNIGNTMPVLEVLSLSTNNFTGSIPHSLCRLVHVRHIDLSNNFLYGEIPNCWNASLLQGIDFSNNSLFGGIPASLCSKLTMQSLHLSRNSLSGVLPPSLMNCSYLVTLDLGHNNFTGEIPIWVGQGLRFLKVLSLRSNSIVGTIPFQLLLLQYLQILDLSHNKLSGQIPVNIGNLTAMKTIHPGGAPLISGYIKSNDFMNLFIKGGERYYEDLISLQMLVDLSSNNLSGSIPGRLADLIGLRSLNLSGNYLEESIITNIGNLQQLEFLDLSRNRLSGAIPLSLAAIPHLSMLNLSYNYLSGRIPTGDQLRTLDDPSVYMENLNLCGFPLLRKCDGDAPSSETEIFDGVNEEGTDVVLTCASIALGFVFGFWALFWVFWFRKEWGDVYFRCIDETYDNCAFFSLKLKRRLC